MIASRLLLLLLRGRLLFVLLVALPLALACSACWGCARDKHIAEVKTHKGDVKRDTASSLQKWEPAKDGARLAVGDGLKTGASSEAKVRVVGGGTIAVESDTTIRFLAGKPGAAGASPGQLAVETGEASIEADAERELLLETTIGLARIEAGGKLRVSAADGSTRFEVTVGGARLETDDGGGIALSPGRAIEVSVGGAIVERDLSAAAADASAAQAKNGGAAAGADAGDDDAAGTGTTITLDVHGAGVRVQARGTNSWQPLPEGARAASPGDSLEVPNGASVDVRRGARRGRLVGQGRFRIGDGEASGSGALVSASAGRVELEATTDDVLLDVPGGVIVAKTATGEGKSRLQASVGTGAGGGTKVEVRQGRAEVKGSGGSESLRAGESAVLSPKGAVVISGRGPERADFTVRAGESLIVRDPRPPTAVGLDFSTLCPGAAVVSRPDGTGGVRGDHRAAMSLVAGHHEYVVRCIGPDGVDEKPAATGSVTVISDAARAELARLPPSTLVDTDGRRYTVLYQNQLPSVIARWPDAPSASGYVLHVDTQRMKGPAKQTLRTGSVAEGTHVLWYETEDGSKRSGDTTLVIKFDNAAPAASVRDPVDGSFDPGDVVKVSGVVVEGWTVSVNGQAVALDEQKRFSTTATVPAGENGLVLRLSHPKRGTVYYVRHARGTR